MPFPSSRPELNNGDLAESRRQRLLNSAGRIWTVSPTRERKGPNPKPEIRAPKEGRNPKPEMLQRGFGLRYSAFFRVSAFGIRIWAAGDGWYCPYTPPPHPTIPNAVIQVELPAERTECAELAPARQIAG